MVEKTIAIDARELTRKKLRSLGLILLSIMEYLKEYHLLLLSDIAVGQELIPANGENISRGTVCNGGVDVISYQCWIGKVLKEKDVRILYQINHFALIPIKGVKQITVIHDLYVLEGIEKHKLRIRLPYRLFLMLTLVNSSRIFTVSEFSKSRVEKFFWKSKKLVVNYNGIERPFVSAGETQKLVDGPFLLMIGRVNYWKGTLRAIELYNKYLSQSGYKLIIAGQTDGPDIEEKIKIYTRDNDNIIWMDYVSNETREWLMQNCALFLYPSRYDGFGLPPLELAIRNRKVLMNDIPVLREVTRNKGDYINFYGNDDEVIERIKNSLYKSDELQQEALYSVAIDYTWKANADKLKHIIGELLNE